MKNRRLSNWDRETISYNTICVCLCVCIFLVVGYLCSLGYYYKREHYLFNELLRGVNVMTIATEHAANEATYMAYATIEMYAIIYVSLYAYYTYAYLLPSFTHLLLLMVALDLNALLAIIDALLINTSVIASIINIMFIIATMYIRDPRVVV